MRRPPPKEIKTIEQLDHFINFLTENEISYVSPHVYPSITPEIQQIYTLYSQAVKAKDDNFAVNTYISILEKVPNFVAARYNLAQKMRKKGNLDEALRHYVLASRYNSTDLSIFIEIALIFSMQGRKQEAIEAYQHVLKISSDDEIENRRLHSRWLAMVGIGVAYRELKNYEKSIDWLQKTLDWINSKIKFLPSPSAWDSELVATYFEIGILCKEIGDWANSEKMFLSGIKIAAESRSLDHELRMDETYIWMHLGELYSYFKRWDEAEYYLAKCVHRHPNDDMFQQILEDVRNKKIR